MPEQSDTFLPCRSLLRLAEELAALADLAEAPPLAARLRGMAGRLLAGGLDGAALTGIISDLNDRLTVRIIELTARRHRLPPVAWCWLALGSEGRQEQTLVGDQDNGLIFSAADAQEAVALRQLFLPFAQEVNQQLAACGFTLCPGNIMAGNPAWCLSLDEWQRQFIEWVRRPEPQALLNASIFFDLRPLCGDVELAEKLRSLLLALTTDTPAFLHLMAANALQAEVPLGFLGDVLNESGKAGEGLDLKKFGSRIFVDAARILALAGGVRAVNSTRRLLEGGRQAGLPANEIAAVNAAFSHILRLRLHHQWAGGAGQGIQPAALDDFERAVLRAGLQQARRMQQRLKLNYGL